MISDIGTFCSAACYLLAFSFGLFPLLRRSMKFRSLSLFLLAFGLALHTASLIHLHIVFGGRHFSGMQGFFSIAAWGVVVTGIYWTLRRPSIRFDLFFLPIALALLGFDFFPGRAESSHETIAPLWRFLHIFSLLLSILCLAVGSVAGAMYLEQSRCLKEKRRPRLGLSLPSLEWSGNLSRDALFFAFLALVFAAFSGMHLHFILQSRGMTSPIAFEDPLVLGSCMLLLFLFSIVVGPLWYRLLAHRRALYALLLFALLLIMMALALLSDRSHWTGVIPEKTSVEKAPSSTVHGRVKSLRLKYAATSLSRSSAEEEITCETGTAGKTSTESAVSCRRVVYPGGRS